MTRPRAGILALALLVVAGSAAAEEADPFQGKTLEEIEKMIEGRMAERKKDREFASDFKSYFKREEGKVVRTGIKLATGARTSGEYIVAEYLFRYGQYTKSLEMLLKLEKKNRKSRNPGNRWLMVSIHLLMAADYAYIGKVTDAGGAIRRARSQGGIGATLNDVNKKLLDYPALRRELESLRAKRDIAPKGGASPGDNQWALCTHLQGRVFLPVEEYVEIGWMIKAFPAHEKVKSGEAAWFQVECARKLLDYRLAAQLAEAFQSAYPNHWATTRGDALWALALAEFGKGSHKDAKRHAELLKRKYPKARDVENKKADQLIAECDKPSAQRDRFSQRKRWYHW
jgi:tetratricopeptide (TPR) repeat protein